MDQLSFQKSPSSELSTNFKTKRSVRSQRIDPVDMSPLLAQERRFSMAHSVIMQRRSVHANLYAELLAADQIKGKTAENASIHQHEPSRSEIFKFLFVMSLCMVAALSGQYMNVCTPLLRQKYNWDTKKKEDLNVALMNTIPAIGAIVGSASASTLMLHGRARAFVISVIVGIVGSTMALVQYQDVFLISKFIVGSAIGLNGVIIARYIEEYVPLKWLGISQAISFTCLQLGIFLATIMGAILPD